MKSPFSVIFCISIFVLALAIPTTYYGYADEDSTCQEGLRAGMNLSTWVKVTGLVPIAITGMLYLASLIMHFTPASINILLANASAIILILDLFFYMTWWIIGVVILATNENNECVADGKAMAVLAIINLVIGEIRFGYLQAYALE